MINRRCIVVLIAAALAFVAVRASAQHHHPPQDVAIHERFYRTWKMPDNPSVSCCDNRDCYPTEAKIIDGTWFARRREDGVWLRVPPEKVEQNRDNPDGRNHLCAPPPDRVSMVEVFCFTVGSGI